MLAKKESSSLLLKNALIDLADKVKHFSTEMDAALGGVSRSIGPELQRCRGRLTDLKKELEEYVSYQVPL